MSKTDPYGLSRPSLPATYAKVLLDVLLARGVDTAEILQGCNLPRDVFTRPESRISARQWSKLVLGAIHACDDDGLGYEYGLSLPATAHGMLAFAAMSAPTLGAALSLAVTFFSMRLRDYRIALSVQDGVAIVDVVETHPVVGGSEDDASKLRRFFYETVMLTMVKIADELTGSQVSRNTSMKVDWPKPDYHVRYRQRLPAIHFRQSANQILLPESLLSLPLPAANETAYQQALSYCEQEKVRFSRELEDVAEQVRVNLVLEPYEGFPDIDTVSAKMNISSRTLKRRLQQVGTSFLRLQEGVQRKEAEALLSDTDMAIQDIASLLGYKGAANFSRAFRRWTNETPRQYRESVPRS